MNHPRAQVIIEEMVKAILNDLPGFVQMGNVWMEWDGENLTWDTPLSQWDTNAVWRSLMEQATRHSQVEHIASCAHDLADLERAC